MPALSVTLDWGDLAVATTAILGLAAIVGGIVRFGLVPYLEERLVRPAQQTNRIVTGGEDEPDVRQMVDQLTGEIEDATLELRAMALMFDGHLEWSQAEVDKLWAELRRQADAGARPDPRHKHRKDTR